MEIKFNENNEILEYAMVGDLSDGLEIDDSIIPDDFEENFKPSFYLFKDNEIIINSNYEEPTISIQTPKPSEPSKEWQAINMLALQVAQLKAEKGGA